MQLSQHTPSSRLRMEREQRGWTQLELARRCGLSPGTVGLVESGGWPRPDTLALLAGAFSISLTEAARWTLETYAHHLDGDPSRPLLAAIQTHGLDGVAATRHTPNPQGDQP